MDTIYTQFVKLAIDLQPLLRFFPWWSLLIVTYVLFEHWRKKFALNKLRKCEAKNCGFINALPIVSMTCGSMGKRKTTMITDMALSQEVMFRQKAFDILQKADMKFPYFPWICFEKELASCIEYGTVYNLATVKEWVNLKRSRYEKHGNALWQLYGYDCQRYGLTYNDALKTSGLFDVLETYAQAFFIYALETSLIVANYSVRTDNQILTEDNFPLWALDFFSDGQRQSRHSHILDFDVLRLGKKILDNNPKAGSFEFGVVAITEIGKERGNNLELKEVKKKNDETNQKNDLFNSWLKMCRHSATVDNFPFIKVFTDEQRPESWGADARDLCDIVNTTPDFKDGTAISNVTYRKHTGGIKIYAKFKKLNTLSFVVPDDVSAIESQKMIAGNRVTLPQPTKTGYTFNGWYTDSEFTNKVDNYYVMPDSDIVLYARFTKNETTLE